MSLTPPPPYCDCTIDGHKVELVPGSHLLHNGQRVELPNGENVLFPRLSPDGQRFAGIGHVSGIAWEWIGQWHNRGPAEGPNAVIYDLSGALHIVSETEGAPTGSQGYRYVDDSGRLVGADETYNPDRPIAHANGITHLWEFTVRGDVAVGQGGDEEGLQALVRGRRILVDDGYVRNIHFYRQGDDRLALAYVKHAREATFWFGAVAQWDARPTYVVPGPKPQPDPEPEKDPEPMAYERRSPDYTALVEDIARRFPVEWEAARKAPDKERTHAFVRRFAWEAAKVDPKIGLNGKRGNPNDLSADAVAYRNETAPGGAEVIDIIIGAGHKPAWQDATLPNVLGRYVAPSDPGGDSGDPGDENDAQVHVYDGGENDTGECDVILPAGKCNRPPGDPIHLVKPKPQPQPETDTRPVADPRLEPAVREVRALAARAGMLAAALAVIPKPVERECPPCDREHRDAPVFPVASEPELQARVADWVEAWQQGSRRIMPPDLTAYLLYRFLVEGATHEALLAEARAR